MNGATGASDMSGTAARVAVERIWKMPRYNMSAATKAREFMPKKSTTANLTVDFRPLLSAFLPLVTGHASLVTL